MVNLLSHYYQQDLRVTLRHCHTDVGIRGIEHSSIWDEDEPVDSKDEGEFVLALWMLEPLWPIVELNVPVRSNCPVICTPLRR